MKKLFIIGLGLLLSFTTSFYTHLRGQILEETPFEKMCLEDVFEIQFSHRKIAIKYLDASLSNATISIYGNQEAVLEDIPLQARKNTFSFAQPVAEGLYKIAITQNSKTYYTQITLSNNGY